MKTFLFQGDSITDANRSRDYPVWMGSGFSTIVAGELSCRYPGEYKFINMGISGNRSVDLYGRNGRDVIANKPDYMTLLIGVNDIWHNYSGSGFTPEQYSKILDALLDETRAALPDLKLFVLEPLLGHGYNTNGNYDDFRSKVEDVAARCKEKSDKYGGIFIPLMKDFDELVKVCDIDGYWLEDGVHPSYAGNTIIARKVLDTFEKNK